MITIKQHPIYSNYLIFDDGRIYSYKASKFLKPLDNGKGYLYVSFYTPKQRNFRIHRLVAEAFLENPNSLPEVNHIDGNKANNHVSNLMWCTRQYNCQHAYASGLKTPKFNIKRDGLTGRFRKH